MSFFGDAFREFTGRQSSERISDGGFMSQAFFKRRAGGAGKVYWQQDKRSMVIYDTTLGGAKEINPPPQFTRWADVKETAIFSKSRGMGNYYREAIFQNQQRVSLCFGVPEYNSLAKFFSTFYDTAEGQLVHYGEVSLSYQLGYAVGFLFTLPFQVFFGAVNLAQRIISTATGNPYTKFYYLKPTMALYWNAVTLMFNKLGSDMGALRGATMSDFKMTPGSTDMDMKKSVNAELGAFASMYPDIVRQQGKSGAYIIDVKSISSRSQRYANMHYEKATALASSSSSHKEFLRKYRANMEANADKITINEQTVGMPEYMKKYAQSKFGSTAQASTKIETGGVDAEGKPVTTITNKAGGATIAAQSFHDDSIWQYLKGELSDGSLFVTFAVDNPGPQSASFSNTTKEIPTLAAANSMSSAAKDAYVSLAGGNIGDGLVASAVEAAVGTVAKFLGGMLDSVGLGGAIGLAGKAFMEAPEMWDAATAELPSANYTIKLNTPYGNPYSILTRIYLPLCCLLAGALPRRTGKSSYGPPFLCSAYQEGFLDIKLGIIKGLRLSMGTGGVGRSVDGLPTSIDVNLEIASLDNVMSVPIADSLAKSVFSFGAFDEDTPLSGFLGSLAGVTLHDQFYMRTRLKRAWRTQAANWESFKSPAYWTQWAANTGVGRIISAVTQPNGDL